MRENTEPMPEAARALLMYVVFPVWVAAGFADWACHRRTRIAQTSGLRENLLHLLLFAEMGAGIVAVVLLEINAAVLLLALVLFAVHELTVYWDLHWSVPRREVGPFEQMVHSFMEILPLASIGLLAALAWPQALALAGLGAEPADWSLRWKSQPLPPGMLLAGLALSVVFNAVPLAQETWSCVRWRLRLRTRGSPGPT
ncbi:diguanylate cyclase [Ramlibacter sp.]|uniref:diguanylate cyclase n=1 Tax=Ramlibacter sp. TaxID=1917967 RepID=UPI002B5DE724|nr:diguanylate cyclase [Ramlibacter sp.]HWI81207.1 diguanylate cyclase [Ramlibacter sp.]